MEVTMFQMGFGESILLHDDESCLLVDCGSESPHKEDCFANVVRELEKYQNRSLLISHFHTDHINGIKYLCEKYSHGFNMIYVPDIFTAGNRSLDLLITQWLLEGIMNQRRRAYHIWHLLLDLVKAKLCIRPIRRDDQFTAASCDFQALWPMPDEIAPELERVWDLVNDRLPYYQQFCSNTEQLVSQTNEVVLALSRSNLSNEEYTQQEKRLKLLIEIYDNAQNSYIETIKVEIGIEKFKRQIQELYEHISNVNDTSIVFHTVGTSTNRVLMTGDAGTTTLERIIDEMSINHTSKMIHYDIIKAPHHGTKSCYIDFTRYFEFDTLMISNGRTTRPDSKRGTIYEGYLQNTATYNVACTNTIHGRCEYIKNKEDTSQCSEHCPNCLVRYPQINIP